MDILNNLILGFGVAVTPIHLLYALIGVMLGTLIGVLPGVGPVATIAMLLPITFNLSPVAALIMLAGIYYGAQYGGSTTAILVNIPGEISSVVTALDGYQMARQGQAGKALATAALGSFFAGTVATILIALFAPPLAQVALEFGPPDYFSLMVLGLVAAVGSFIAGCFATAVIAFAAPALAEVALKFGPAEYFSLMVLGLICATVLAHGSVVKAIIMILTGLLVGIVG
ncbi:MAG TPA: tripartite tricarboxylate transporter permease, partial [Burkholderiales bacterium]